MFFADRVSWIGGSCTIAMSVKAKTMRAKGLDVIDLGVGEPDLDTPENIKQAGIEAIKNNKTKYTLMNGIIPLREEICKLNNGLFGTDYGVDNVLVAPGAKFIIFAAFMATINPGDEVIIPAPGWVSYSDIVKLFGGKPVIIQGSPENNFKITPEQVVAHITPKTKWLLLNSPSNPTGAIYNAAELKALSEVLLKHKDIWLMTDDIYYALAYDGHKFTNMLAVAPELQKRAIVINGFSKCFRMTGWRLGYGLAPQELIKEMSKIQSQALASVCHIVQEAGAYALAREDQSDVEEMRLLYQERRNIAFGLLNQIKGIKPYMPDGAFYIFTSIKDILGKKGINTDEDFVHYVLDKHLVSTVHGTAFYTPGYFRISFATTEDLLREAIKRIAKAVEEINS